MSTRELVDTIFGADAGQLKMGLTGRLPLTERDALQMRWLAWFEQWPLLVTPVLCDLPPPQRIDVTPEGQRATLESMRASLIAPMLGLPGLAVPVGRAGRLRTGVQIMATRWREDLCLDAGEVVEAGEEVVGVVDPVGR